MDTSPQRRGIRPHVFVRLLGAYLVRIDDRPVPPQAWGTRRSVELVELLALAPGHRLHRDRVIEALWPHLGAAAGAANLHKAAHVARRSLHEPAAVVLRGGQVALWPQAVVATDVEAFEAKAIRALRLGDPAACRDAAALYGGDLLPDERYEDWAAGPRERLRELVADVLRAAGLWEQVLAHDPTDERATRALMRRYAELGERGAAVRQFERLRIALWRELGLEPAPETVALCEEVAGRAGRGKVPGRSPS